MSLILYKILTTIQSHILPVIRKSGLSIQLTSDIAKLRDSVLSRNQSTFDYINGLITGYLMNSKHSFRIRFDEKTLWQIADSRYSQNTLGFILENDSTFLTMFEDIKDLIRISKVGGAINVLLLFLKKGSIELLNERLSAKELIQIASRYGAKSIFDCVVNTKSFNILIERLGKEGFFKIANNNGSKHVFDLILDNDCYQKLLDRLGIDAVIKIGSNSGAKKIFDHILNDKKYKTIMSLVDKKQFAQIARNQGSVKVIDLILDPRKFPIILKKIGKDNFFKIAINNGSRQVFDILLKDNNFDTLKDKLGEEELIDVASQYRVSKVLEILLDPDMLETLLDRIGKVALIKITHHQGAVALLEMILDKSIFDTLLNRLGKDSLFEIICDRGTRKLFDLILDQNTLAILKDYFGEDNLVKIAKHTGSKQVLDLFLNPQNIKILEERIGKDNIIKIARRGCSSFIFELIIDTTTYELLLERIGKIAMIEIASYHGAKKVFDMILDSKIFDTLVERLGKKGCFDILIHPNISFILKKVLDSKTWDILSRVFNSNNLLKITSIETLRNSFSTILTSYTTLSPYLSPNCLYRYAILSPEKQKGLSLSNIHVLMTKFLFKEQEVLTLAELSGQFIPYIMDLFYIHKPEIDRLFQGENTLPLLNISPFLNSFLHRPAYPHLNQDAFFFMTLTKLNRYCTDVPLSLEELQYLKEKHTKTPFQTFQLDNLMKITGGFGVSERTKLWESIFSTLNLNSEKWMECIQTLSLPLRKWFIEKGECFIHSMINPKHPSDTPCTDDNYSDNLKYMDLCIKVPKVRKYIYNTYQKRLLPTTVHQRPKGTPKPLKRVTDHSLSPQPKKTRFSDENSLNDSENSLSPSPSSPSSFLSFANQFNWQELKNQSHDNSQSYPKDSSHPRDINLWISRYADQSRLRPQRK